MKLFLFTWCILHDIFLFLSLRDLQKSQTEIRARCFDRAGGFKVDTSLGFRRKLWFVQYYVLIAVSVLSQISNFEKNRLHGTHWSIIQIVILTGAKVLMVYRNFLNFQLCRSGLIFDENIEPLLLGPTHKHTSARKYGQVLAHNRAHIGTLPGPSHA